MNRMYRLQANETPDDIAKRGGGDVKELWAANKTWLSSAFAPWNPGQQMVVPSTWQPLEGEYAGE